MARKFLCRTFVLVCLLCGVVTSSVFASDLSNNDVVSGQEIEETNDTGGETGTGGTETGEDIPTIDSDGLSETVVEVVTSEQKVFAPLPIIDEGEATQTDLYNALASIHNLGLLAFIVALIVWTYRMITSAYRRFIG